MKPSFPSSLAKFVHGACGAAVRCQADNPVYPVGCADRIVRVTMRAMHPIANRIIVACAIALLSATNLDAQTDKASKVPAWDARGLGPLPWQGVSALQMSADGSRIVLGTIAPPDDPNVIVVDGAGNVTAHHALGQRWIESVSALPDGASVMALCTHADGRANDFPALFLRGAQTVNFPPAGTEEGFATAAFHYGDHSNHLGVRALSCTGGIWVSTGKSASWHVGGQPKADFTLNLAIADDAVSTTAAALPNGILVLGHAARVVEGQPLPANVHALKPDERKPLWTRAALNDLPPVPPPEKGAYGAPTRRDGRKLELEQWDVPVSGPLSIALHAAADGSLARVVTADYRGWQRWVRSSATMNAQHIGTRFVPSRPAISVLDGNGALVRRFEAAQFAEAAWLDLRFLPDRKWIVAWPHRWNSRGLGGSAFLPSDATARHIYLLNADSGEVRSLALPDAVADLALDSRSGIIVSCWDGGCYRMSEAQFAAGVALPKPVKLGGPALLAVAGDGKRIIAARADGVVIAMDADLHEQWRCDLNQAVPHADKPWVAKAEAQSLAAGLWGLPGGRVESDLGGQRVIEAPDGLILIEGHAGLSFEREWAAIKQAGLDPMRVKYVLATHEHGDHAPGAYLWRVVTGAQFVCSEEMAYTLQHHIPLNTGYGFHPPVPTDVRIKEDAELDLAGLKVRAIHVPGHTAGSMAWSFEKDGKRFLAIGDLIMPHGPLGYSGSIGFSAHDVLASLKKLQTVNADFILPGHGPVLPPDAYLGEGIEMGERVGWGKIPPTRPDPRFRITQQNVIVAAWGFDAQSAAFGDFNGDARPDIAIVSLNAARDGAIVRIFFNHTGRFAEVPDKEIALPGIVGDHLKIATADINGDAVPDFLVSGQSSSALLLSKGREAGYTMHPLAVGEVIHVFAGEDPKRAPLGVAFARRFGAVQQIVADKDGRLNFPQAQPEMSGPYLDLRRIDLNGDGTPDIVTSYGQILLQAGAPLRLLPPDSKWRFFAVGDFNGDRRPDLLLGSYETQTPAAEYLNTGDREHPFRSEPTQVIAWPAAAKDKRRPGSLIRETIAVADWNGDGRDDVLFAIGQDKEVHILPGSAAGLDASKRTVVPLDYHLHYETGLFVGDFNGDGKPDIAALGYTETGVGTNGPLAVYIWCQP